MAQERISILDMGDSSLEVFSQSKTNAGAEQESHHCYVCGKVDDEQGCPSFLGHTSGLCLRKLREDVGVFPPTKKKSTIYLDLGVSNMLEKRDDTEPIDTQQWLDPNADTQPILEEETQELTDYDGATQPIIAAEGGEQTIRHETQVLPETVLRKKLKTLFDREETTTFEDFLMRLKDAIDFSIEQNLSIQAFTLRDRLSEDRLKADKISVENAVRLVSLAEFKRLYEGLNYLMQFKVIRDEEALKLSSGEITESDVKLPEENYRALVKSMLVHKIEVPHRITLHHQEDLGNRESEGTSTLRAWLQTLIFKRKD